jgi:hypothetical protein
MEVVCDTNIHNFSKVAVTSDQDCFFSKAVIPKSNSLSNSGTTSTVQVFLGALSFSLRKIFMQHFEPKSLPTSAYDVFISKMVFGFNQCLHTISVYFHIL